MQLKGITVHDVHLGQPGSPTAVTATVQEKVQLYAQSGQVEEALDYPVKYDFEFMWHSGAGFLMTSCSEV